MQKKQVVNLKILQIIFHSKPKPITVSRVQSNKQVMSILSIRIKCMTYRVWIAEMDRFYRILQLNFEVVKIDTRSKLRGKWASMRLRILNYLVLRIEVADENSIPVIEDQIRPFTIVVRRNSRIDSTRSSQRTNPTSGCNGFTGTIASDKTKRAASIPTA